MVTGEILNAAERHTDGQTKTEDRQEDRHTSMQRQRHKKYTDRQTLTDTDGRECFVNLVWVVSNALLSKSNS